MKVEGMYSTIISNPNNPDAYVSCIKRKITAILALIKSANFNITSTESSADLLSNVITPSITGGLKHSEERTVLLAVRVHAFVICFQPVH